MQVDKNVGVAQTTGRPEVQAAGAGSVALNFCFCIMCDYCGRRSQGHDTKGHYDISFNYTC